MIYLEMSRDETHGGGAWRFPNCLWSPSKKEDGSRWPFWEKVLSVREGDTVIHLRGVKPRASFVGFSRASGNGFITNQRPPNPGKWSFAHTFHRADLSDYTSFHTPIPLLEIFTERRPQLEAYFDDNKRPLGKNIFYVRQGGKLQCLNGAYLSEVEESLLVALFGDDPELKSQDSENRSVASVETGFQIREIRIRLGQKKFSDAIKRLYRNRCCFPECPIDDARLLVGAHIARWSDNESLQGRIGNGLCLCVFHDKAFEIGLFTLDSNHRICVNPKESVDSTAISQLLPFNGREIALAAVSPLVEALREHWARCDFGPLMI